MKKIGFLLYLVGLGLAGNASAALVAHYEFENDVTATIGVGGVATGVPTYGLGKVGNAVIFDGLDDSVDIADSPATEFTTGDFTVAFWVKVDPFPSGGVHQVFSNGNAKRYEFGFFAGNFNFDIDDDVTKTPLAVPQESVATGEWVHVAGVRDRR